MAQWVRALAVKEREHKCESPAPKLKKKKLMSSMVINAMHV